MKNLLLIGLLGFVLACEQKLPLAKKEIVEFKNPTIVQNLKSRKWIYFSDSTMIHLPGYPIGKSKFCDSLFLNSEEFFAKAENTDCVYDPKYRIDSLDMTGFEVIPDNKTKIYFKRWGEAVENAYYPIYLVNSTSSSKYIYSPGETLPVIHEALDSNNNWSPIEYRGTWGCGSGQRIQKINPNEFFMLFLPIYEGNYKTKLRVRINVGNCVYVSKPFDGTINYQQFFINKNEFKEIKNGIIPANFDWDGNFNFLGGTPLEKRKQEGLEF